MKLAREAEERPTKHPRSLAPRPVLFPSRPRGLLVSRLIRCGGTLGMGIKTIWLDVAFRLHGSDIICIPQQSCSGPVQDATGDSVSYCALGPSTRYLGKHSMVSIEYLT